MENKNEELEYDYKNPDFNFTPGTLINSAGEKVIVDFDEISLVEDEKEYGDLKEVKVSQEDYELGNIKCPFTGTSDIYRISDEIYASFETDQKFRIVII